jgi:hypothetical protein
MPAVASRVVMAVPTGVRVRKVAHREVKALRKAVVKVEAVAEAAAVVATGANAATGRNVAMAHASGLTCKPAALAQKATPA